MSAPPVGVGSLAYLYVGVADVGRAVDFYVGALGATFEWRFDAFDTEVAAVRLASGDGAPLVLLAGHRPVPSVLPIWTVPSVSDAAVALAASGFGVTGETAGTPDGPVHVLADPDGNEIGLLQQDRPNALAAAYADPDNPRAVH